jgi:hypothetical protein
MLLKRDQAGDREKAAALLDAALSTVRELGMRALEDWIRAATEQTVTPSPVGSSAQNTSN